MHRLDVAMIPERSVNAEYPDGTFGPRSITDLAADNPSVKIGKCDRSQRSGSSKQRASPASGSRGTPFQRIAGIMTKSLLGRMVRRPAFLGEDDVGLKGPDQA